MIKCSLETYMDIPSHRTRESESHQGDFWHDGQRVKRPVSSASLYQLPSVEYIEGIIVKRIIGWTIERIIPKVIERKPIKVPVIGRFRAE